MSDEIEFGPDDFRDEDHGGFEGALKAFLEHPANVARMVTASDLGEPAIVGVAHQLLAVFGERLDDDSSRQLAGRLVRPIMEDKRFVIDMQDVKVTTYPFSKATRYRRSNAILLHVFRASKDPREVCIGRERSDEGFPASPGGGKWIFWTTLTNTLQASIGFDINDIVSELRTIDAQGYSRRQVQRLMRRG